MASLSERFTALLDAADENPTIRRLVPLVGEIEAACAKYEKFGASEKSAGQAAAASAGRGFNKASAAANERLRQQVGVGS